MGWVWIKSFLIFYLLTRSNPTKLNILIKDSGLPFSTFKMGFSSILQLDQLMVRSKLNIYTLLTSYNDHPHLNLTPTDPLPPLPKKGFEVSFPMFLFMHLHKIRVELKAQDRLGVNLFVQNLMIISKPKRLLKLGAL